MELGDIIKDIRKPLTQQEFADSIGATKQQVSDWERNVYRPQPEHLAAMGITIRYEIDTQSRATPERTRVEPDHTY